MRVLVPLLFVLVAIVFVLQLLWFVFVVHFEEVVACFVVCCVVFGLFRGFCALQEC
jgi:hypothetical protein